MFLLVLIAGSNSKVIISAIQVYRNGPYLIPPNFSSVYLSLLYSDAMDFRENNKDEFALDQEDSDRDWLDEDEDGDDGEKCAGVIVYFCVLCVCVVLGYPELASDVSIFGCLCSGPSCSLS